MKKEIHPKYYKKGKIVCACGAVFEMGSTQELTQVEICSQCHPFYTGKERLIKTGQVEKFEKRMSKIKAIQASTTKKKKKKVKKVIKKS